MRLSPFLLLFCVACEPGDAVITGLLDPGGKEETLPDGTSQANPGDDDDDDDDDGLADSDGDTYLNQDELTEGTDPYDYDSRIYTGFWPYNPDKEAISDPGFSGGFTPGDVVGRHMGKDQFGDTVDLYDLASPYRQYELIAFNVTIDGIGPGIVVSEWISGGGSDPAGLEGDYHMVREAVEDGSLLWVDMLVDWDGADPNPNAMSNWAADYGFEPVPVLSDSNSHFYEGVVAAIGYVPAGILVRADTMEVVAMGGMSEICAAARDRL